MSNLYFRFQMKFVDIGLYQYGWEQCEPSHLLDLPPETIISFTM